MDVVSLLVVFKLDAAVEGVLLEPLPDLLACRALEPFEFARLRREDGGLCAFSLVS